MIRKLDNGMLFNNKLWHSCEKKRRYKNKKNAMNALRSYKKLGLIIPSNAHAYECSFCGGFHLGHKHNVES